MLIYSDQSYLLRLGFSVKLCKTMIQAKLCDLPFPNPLIRYVYGHNPQAIFLVYKLAKIYRKCFYKIRD